MVKAGAGMVPESQSISPTWMAGTQWFKLESGTDARYGVSTNRLTTHFSVVLISHHSYLTFSNKHVDQWTTDILDSSPSISKKENRVTLKAQMMLAPLVTKYFVKYLCIWKTDWERERNHKQAQSISVGNSGFWMAIITTLGPASWAQELVTPNWSHMDNRSTNTSAIPFSQPYSLVGSETQPPEHEFEL